MTGPPPVQAGCSTDAGALTLVLLGREVAGVP